jgi:cell division protein YceG involved in septum cleavage
MSLLNKIITSSLAENKTTRRLQEISYSAINGERQEVKNYQPEGVIMPGQLNRERPLDAITKEMIQEFQEQESKKKDSQHNEERSRRGEWVVDTL